MITMPSVEAQNRFGYLADKAQREIVAVTRRGRVSVLVMSPEVLEDYVEGQLATEALAEGFATDAQVEALLNSVKDA